jgi:hypothetical protein
MALAKATGALVALSVEKAGQIMVIDVLPGSSPLALEPVPGVVVLGAKIAVVRAHQQAHRHDLRAVIDADGPDRGGTIGIIVTAEPALTAEATTAGP